MYKLIEPIVVGIPIPHSSPLIGGAYELEASIFKELKALICGHKAMSGIEFVAIETASGQASSWDIPSNRVVRCHINFLTRIFSALHARFRAFLKPYLWLSLSGTIKDRVVCSQLSSEVDIIWHLGPSVVTVNIPYVVTVWDLEFRKNPFFSEVSCGGEWELRESHYAEVLRKSFMVVSGTSEGIRQVSRFYGVDKSRIVRNPFPAPSKVNVGDQAKRDVLDRYSLRESEFIFYPAQFWSHKNHLLVLLALNELRSRGVSLKLVLTGSDKGEFSLIKKTIHDLGLEELVLAPGFISREHIACLYSSALCLVFPSFFGPDNLPPLEAMTYGVPALVADVPGAFDHYGSAAMYFDPQDPVDLSEVIIGLHEDRLLRTDVIKKGFEFVDSLTPLSYIEKIVDQIANRSYLIRLLSPRA